MTFYPSDDFLSSSLPIYKSLAQLKGPFLFYEDNNQKLLKSGIENPYFNFLLIKNSQDTVFEKAFEFFNHLPFECTFRRDNSLLIHKCKEQGLIFGENTTRMILDLRNVQYSVLESNITIRQVQNNTDMRLWINTTALGFGLSRNYIKNFFYPIFFANHKNFRFSLCFLNNIPVAASVLFLNPPCATIFSLATRSQFRKKGLASYLLQEELLKAKNSGIISCAVHATSQGEALYKKLGFQINEELTTFIFTRSLQS